MLQCFVVIDLYRPAIYFEIFNEKCVDFLGFLALSLVGEGIKVNP